MRIFFRMALCALLLEPWLLGALLHAASAELLKAKQEAEAKGYIFIASRDEILARAKQEGRLRAISSMSPVTIKALIQAFRKKYPFIDAYAEEITGTEALQRFLLEIKTGRLRGWDAGQLSTDAYNEYLPYLRKFDVLGMALHGVLQAPAKLVDPENRSIVALASDIQVVAYNSKLLPAERVPKAWHDFLKPEFKGRKFLADIRPTEIAALVPAWGLERTLDIARKIASQEPVWVRGHIRALTAMQAGEAALMIGANFRNVNRIAAKDHSKSLSYEVIEPVPARLYEAIAVFATSEHPHAALLWLEFQASAEGQKIIDEHEPNGGSILAPGSALEKLTQGRKLSLVNWEHYTRMPDYQAKVVQAYGFPKAEMQQRK